MAKVRSLFVCQGCGFQSAKWLGRCPECSEWSSLVEEMPAQSPSLGAVGRGERPTPIGDVRLADTPRYRTGLGELDRVLGGGLVQGSLVLLGGEPGIGKSTLLLQALSSLCHAGHKVLYVSGEESIQQTAMRAERLGVTDAQLLVVAETDLDRILKVAEEVGPAVLAVDSVQTTYASALGSVPGSLGQVREAAGRFLTLAKRNQVPVILVGHVTKDGQLAGPKTLEHVVDAVLHFEGDRAGVYRILRATKNRFG
jgi:DNA repair protein RadA/Sms